MSTPSHTPGPWKVEADPENAGKHYYHDHRFVTRGKGTLDSDKSHYENDCSKVCMLFDTENQLEDARLIAAAPDLLAELQNIANANTREWDDPDDFKGWAQSRARFAIAKATGVQPLVIIPEIKTV